MIVFFFMIVFNEVFKELDKYVFFIFEEGWWIVEYDEIDIIL